MCIKAQSIEELQKVFEESKEAMETANSKLGARDNRIVTLEQEMHSLKGTPQSDSSAYASLDSSGSLAALHASKSRFLSDSLFSSTAISECMPPPQPDSPAATMGDKRRGLDSISLFSTGEDSLASESIIAPRLVLTPVRKTTRQPNAAGKKPVLKNKNTTLQNNKKVESTYSLSSAQLQIHSKGTKTSPCVTLKRNGSTRVVTKHTKTSLLRLAQSPSRPNQRGSGAGIENAKRKNLVDLNSSVANVSKRFRVVDSKAGKRRSSVFGKRYNTRSRKK